MKTPMQQLKEAFKNSNNFTDLQKQGLDNTFEVYIEAEKQQIINAYGHADSDRMRDAEQYYSQTYNKTQTP